MTEEIKILLRNTPQIIIWNLMCAHAEKIGKLDKLDEVFPDLRANGNDTVIQAELIVNGVSLPVMDSLNAYWLKAEETLDQRARDMTAETLKGSRLQSLMNRLSAIEWEVHDDLDKLFPNTHRKDY